MSLARLRERIAEHEEDAQILVSLDEFFEGNDDDGSIGCNLTEHPGVERFRVVLLGLRNRPDVDDVLVRINDPLDGDEWPNADTVYVVGRLSKASLQGWTAALCPDSVEEGALPDGRPALVVWWD